MDQTTTVLQILLLFSNHYIADWLLQSLHMGKLKSEKFSVLLQHISIHFVVFFIFGLLISLKFAVLTAILNSIIHGTIDWFIWRGYKVTVWKRKHEFLPYFLNKTCKSFEPKQREWLKMYFRYWEDKVFSWFLGLDQLLHYISLVIIWGVIS